VKHEVTGLLHENYVRKVIIMALAKYPPMDENLKKLQENDSRHNPGSEAIIPDQTSIPVISISFLNRTKRKELTTGEEKPSFPLIIEDANGPMEPQQLVYLAVADDAMEDWGMTKGTYALLNPNVPVENNDFACVRWKETWFFCRVHYAADGHVELEYAPDKSIRVGVEEKGDLEIVARSVSEMTFRPVKNIPIEDEQQQHSLQSSLL
jgi:hypothetical protein